MKLRKKALVMALCGVMVLAAFSGSAMSAFYTCTISECGSAGTFYTATLTDVGGAFSNTGFVLDAATAGANAMLAAMLTAYSTGGKVRVWLNSTAASSNIFSASAIN